MLNEVFKPNKHRSMPVPTGTKSGDPLRIGSINGIAATDRARVDGVAPYNADGTINSTYNYGGGNPEGYASVWTEGGYSVVVTAAAAPAFGDQVFFDNAATPKLTMTNSGTLKVWGIAEDDNPTDNGDGTYTVVVNVANPIL